MWDYSSLHLKIAGGMAVAASGKSIRVLLDETLADLGMTNSYYDMDQNPELAGSLYTTGTSLPPPLSLQPNLHACSYRPGLPCV